MKGDVNFTLETIEKIEDALDVDLIEVQIKRSPVKLINNAVSETLQYKLPQQSVKIVPIVRWSGVEKYHSEPQILTKSIS